MIEFSCDNGLDFELILGEVEAALINSAPHVYDVSTCEMEEEEGAVQAYWEGRAEAGEDVELGRPRALARKAGHAVHHAVASGRDRVVALSPKGRILAGTALLGVAAGIVLGAYIRKR